MDGRADRWFTRGQRAQALSFGNGLSECEVIRLRTVSLDEVLPIPSVRGKPSYLCRTVAVWSVLTAAAAAQSAEPTFLIFKYQHVVGKEIDQCTSDSAGARCHSRFQLDFTG